jgi:hypothetical protein
LHSPVYINATSTPHQKNRNTKHKPAVAGSEGGGSRIPQQKYTRINAWRQYGRPLTTPRYAHPEVLANIVSYLLPIVVPNDAMRVRHDLSLPDQWPTFKDDDFVELLSLRLVHVHDDDPGFRLDPCGKVILYKGLANDLECVQVCAMVTPI